MIIEEIRQKVSKLDFIQQRFFIEIVQSLRNRELRGLEQQFKDIEQLNDLCKQEILNAVKELEKLNKEGKSFTIKEKNEIFNKVLIRTLELQDDKVMSKNKRNLKDNYYLTPLIGFTIFVIGIIIIALIASMNQIYQYLNFIKK